MEENAPNHRRKWEIGGGAKLICVPKVRNFSEIAPNIAFPKFNFYERDYSTFEKRELGRIKKLLPLREMAEDFGLIRKSMKQNWDASRSSRLKGKWSCSFWRCTRKCLGSKRKRSEAIWATREYENRNYCEVNGIQTSFVKLGRPFGEKKGGGKKSCTSSSASTRQTWCSWLTG